MVTTAEGIVVLAATVTVAVAARTTVPTWRTLLAAAPWTVTAALAVVAARAGAYDPLTVPATPLFVTGVVALLAAGSWVGCIQLAALRDLPYRDRYLAASGIAAGSVLGATLLGYTDVSLLRLGWLAIAPIAAAGLAAVGYFLLGLSYTDALAELQLGGLYALAVVAFDGTASVVVERLGGTETAVVTAGLTWLSRAAGQDIPTWALLPTHLAVGIVFVACCGWVARKRRAIGLFCALAGSIVVLWSATVVLASAVLLG
jgi:hypothetical protein